MTKDRLILSLSFLFAFLMWVPQKLTKNYRHTLPLKLSVDHPSDRQLIGTKVKFFPVEIEGKGSKLFRLDGAIKTDTLFLSTSSSLLEIAFPADEILTLIRQKYEIPQDVSLRPTMTQITFDLDSVQTKLIPIESSFTTSFMAGYGQVGNPKLEPDSISITGPHDVVSKIKSIPTAAYAFSNLMQSTSEKIALEHPLSKSAIKLSASQVTVTIDVDEFVEKELIVPLADFQEGGKTWKLFPGQLLVRLSVPLRFHDAVSAGDVGLDLVSQGNQAVSVQVGQLPDNVEYVSHSPKILRYFQQEVDTLQQ